MVGGVPEIVDALAGLEALGGIEGHRVVRIERPGVAADVDGVVGRVVAGGSVDVEVGAENMAEGNKIVVRVTKVF